MSELTNRQYRLAARPTGMPGPEHWQVTEEAVRQPDDGEMLVRVVHLSLDPAMRGWMNDARSYIRPVGIGEIMRAGAIGQVVASRSPRFAAGDYVAGGFGVQLYWTGAADDRAAALTRVDRALAPLPTWLNTLGMPGMTAYFGLLEVGQPQAGETVVVSGAAGAVGQAVGQIARHRGCRAVGIAGGPDKCRFVVEQLGFDACIDYKNESVRDGLKTHCPDGVNVYFDNVGGDILDTVLTRLAMRARIVICGAISQYNNTEPVKGPSNYLSLLVNRARMEGMVVFDYASRYPEAAAQLAAWLRDGTFHSREDIVTGLDRFPEALQMLFKGQNFGKLILQVGEEQ